MKIEVLYVPDCPHRAPAIERVREALSAMNLEVEVHEIAIHDNAAAIRLAFPGSPTIRVNNRDVEPLPSSERSVGIQCRLYSNSENFGVPDRESIVRALLNAVQEEGL